MDRPAIILGVLGYFLIVLAIGVWAVGRTRSPSDFFIAGQRVGTFVAGLATMSAAFSGFVFMGGPGLTYRMGVSALWIVIPVGVTPAMLCWVLAKRLRSLGRTRELFTVADAIAVRFDSPAASGLAAVALALGSLAYLGAQILALGILLQVVFGWTALGPALVVGLLVLLTYSVLGGMVAGVYTDLVQGLFMIAAAAVVFVQALRRVGGWTSLSENLSRSELFGEQFLEPLGRAPVMTAFGFFFVFGVGVLGQPHMLHKFYMLKDVTRLKWMPLILGSSQAVCLLLWLGIGLAVPSLVAAGRMAPLADPDRATPTFILAHLPDALAGLVVAAVLSAIMSTADSFLNIGAAALVRDLPRAFGRPLRRELLWARVAVCGVGLAAAVLAYGSGDLIALLGTLAFGTFAAALAPSLAVGMNWRRVPAAAAIASIATGLISTVVLQIVTRQTSIDWPPEGVRPETISLAASFTALFLVTAMVKPGPGEPADDVAEVVGA